MKTIKVGQINFYKNDLWGDTGAIRINDTINALNKISKNKYAYYDCEKVKCDIVFYSIYDRLERLKLVKGNPLFIYWTDELMCGGPNNVLDNPFEFYKNNNLSISFYDDSDNNLFFPFFVLFLDQMYDMKKTYANANITKNKFCTFCASNAAQYHATYRTELVKYISKNYKEITCCGSVLNNTNGEYLSHKYWEATEYHSNYKFNLCFENYESSNNLSYITEKIINAYTYNTVPIYWGAERITEWFNKESFINCNNLTYKEILEKIKNVDNDDELYQHMLHQKPLKYDFDYYEYFIEKMDKFISAHI